MSVNWAQQRVIRTAITLMVVTHAAVTQDTPSTATGPPVMVRMCFHNHSVPMIP